VNNIRSIPFFYGGSIVFGQFSPTAANKRDAHIAFPPSEMCSIIGRLGRAILPFPGIGGDSATRVGYGWKFLYGYRLAGSDSSILVGRIV